MSGSENSCDVCGNKSLQEVYVPEGSERGLRVHLCNSCGLAQSLPRRDRAPRKSATISADADWGNVRYGKGFRVGAHMSWLDAEGIVPTDAKILDVGANRGAFIEAAQAVWPAADITAIEPDNRVIGAYKDKNGVRVLNQRLEETDLAAAQFDLVYSSHTLEHLASPLDALRDHARVLKAGGYMLLEVPNIELIGQDDIVEEWFIDKHLYHFSRETLALAVQIAGFEIIRGAPDTERVHLTFLLQRSNGSPMVVPKRSEATSAAARIERYKTVRRRNRNNLIHVAARLEQAGGKLVIWGAGRLFDTLVRHGKFDLKKLAGLIDKNLSAYTAERHGITVRSPSELEEIAPDTVFIASRDFVDEIAADVRRRLPTAEIITYCQALGAIEASANNAQTRKEVH